VYEAGLLQQLDRLLAAWGQLAEVRRKMARCKCAVNFDQFAVHFDQFVCLVCGSLGLLPLPGYAWGQLAEASVLS
jgi:hypothetical protein